MNTKITIMLLLIGIISSQLFAQQMPATDINKWDMRQWEAMSTREQELFLSGVLLGTWALAKAYDESSNTRELADKKEYFQQILYYSTQEVRRKLNEENYTLSDYLWVTIYKLPRGRFTPSVRGTLF